MPKVTIAAELMEEKTGYSGKVHAIKGTLRGHDGEWFLVKHGKYHHRFVRIGPDGRSEDISYRVRVGDFVESASTAEVSAPSREFSIVGQRGSVIIAAPFRDRLGLAEGTVVIQVERDGGVLILPAEVVPRVLTGAASLPAVAVPLDRLLDGITPNNLHGEVDTGAPIGREAS